MRIQNTATLALGLFLTPLHAQEKESKPSGQEGPTFRTRHDFDAATIQGERTSPMGTMLDQSSVDQTYDFVTIRRNWRPEMIQSAQSLDTEVKKLPITPED
ncbi:MAG: hypothetical protein HYW48_07055 [Deltaproteobacteria bacterium]|nr:hypothetical protein [Deltaproteobacteria bacterium]